MTIDGIKPLLSVDIGEAVAQPQIEDVIATQVAFEMGKVEQTFQHVSEEKEVDGDDVCTSDRFVLNDKIGWSQTAVSDTDLDLFATFLVQIVDKREG